MKTNWEIHWNSHNTLSWRIWTPRIKHAYKILLSNIKIKENNAKILEIGSGSGENSLEVAKILKPKRIILVDFNRRALEISKETFKDSNMKIDFLEKNIFELKLKEKFDLVHSEGLIEHFYGKKRVVTFKKHIDFCKKGGYVIIFAPYENVNYKIFKLIYNKLDKWIWNEKPVTKEEIIALCKKFNVKLLKWYSSPLIHEIGVLLQKQ